MSNYSQVTSFTPKDSLLTGNPLKLVRGSEFDAEFAAISVAIATKIDSGSSANPTSNIGLAAVNGVLATYMRSDAAPALSQSIAPTWTGAHLFAGAMKGTAADGVSTGLRASLPTLHWVNSGAALDAKLWEAIGTTTTLNFRALNDAQAVARDFMVATRAAGAITNLTLGNSTDNNSFTFAGTGAITAGGVHLGPDGTSANPSYAFSTDPDTGMYRVSANRLGFSVNGTQLLDVTTGGVEVLVGQSFAPAGTALLPGFAFGSDPDTGMYRFGVNTLSWATAGVFAGAITSGQQWVLPDGTIANPVYSFNNDQDTGMYRVGTNNLRLTAGGIDVFGFASSAGVAVNQPFGAIQGTIDGTAGVPLYSFNNDTDTGVYRIGTNNLGFSEGGTGYQIGFRSIPVSATATTLASTDVGRCVAITAAINIPVSVFSAGDAISIYNNSSGALNITISAGTLRLAGTATTGTRSIAARGVVTLWFLTGGATPEVIASGNVS
jgi:hypothetical protein